MIADYFGLDDGDRTLHTFQPFVFSPPSPSLHHPPNYRFELNELSVLCRLPRRGTAIEVNPTAANINDDKVTNYAFC